MPGEVEAARGDAASASAAAEGAQRECAHRRTDNARPRGALATLKACPCRTWSQQVHGSRVLVRGVHAWPHYSSAVSLLHVHPARLCINVGSSGQSLLSS